MKILHVVGARPNFIKVAPVMREMAAHPLSFDQMLVHTGQHYDANMSQIFFDDLDIPKPNIDLEVGSGTHAQQTAEVMKRFEPLVEAQMPDWTIVVGDVNSTLACSLVCGKLGVPVAHIEAGLRSFDRTMPEEINRLLTDRVADLLFTHSPEAEANLTEEGIPSEKIHFVGNVMIDTLVRLLPRAEARVPKLNERFGPGPYILVTIHRDFNVDQSDRLEMILSSLKAVSREIKVIFPVHPRTRRKIIEGGITSPGGDLHLTEPLGYLDFLALEANAALVVTDSGGLQEETTYLGIPCLTVRPNTERPVTITQGTNRLVENVGDLLQNMEAALNQRIISRPRLKFWDGNAAGRIVDVFLSLENGR